MTSATQAGNLTDASAAGVALALHGAVTAVSELSDVREVRVGGEHKSRVSLTSESSWLMITELVCVRAGTARPDTAMPGVPGVPGGRMRHPYGLFA